MMAVSRAFTPYKRLYLYVFESGFESNESILFVTLRRNISYLLMVVLGVIWRCIVSYIINESLCHD
jgi:hypothetical protein